MLSYLGRDWREGRGVWKRGAIIVYSTSTLRSLGDFTEHFYGSPRSLAEPYPTRRLDPPAYYGPLKYISSFENYATVHLLPCLSVEGLH
jgi:hypothetical protein